MVHFYCNFISIHAPTRGATALRYDPGLILLISIHAPTRGATDGVYSKDFGFLDFNPRSYKRSDKMSHLLRHRFAISIHAPTRGATTTSKNKEGEEVFQSTLLQEERQSNKALYNSINNFNPRSYKRSDIVFIRFCKIRLYFNPRSYKRSDFQPGIHALIRSLFQSTLLQEERQSFSSANFLARLFQSTLLQEERQQKCTIILILICNNYCIVSIKSHQHYNNYFM